MNMTKRIQLEDLLFTAGLVLGCAIGVVVRLV